jgi:hypothetical protein
MTTDDSCNRGSSTCGAKIAVSGRRPHSPPRLGAGALPLRQKPASRNVISGGGHVDLSGSGRGDQSRPSFQATARSRKSDEFTSAL